MLKIQPILGIGVFVAIPREECPCVDQDPSGCDNLDQCSYSMSPNHLCKADQTLPDGQSKYVIDNCPTGGLKTNDIYRYVLGK